MYKEANTNYLHINIDSMEQDGIAHCQNQRQSACTLYQLQDAFGGK